MRVAKKLPMTPAEFDAACRELVRRCPFLSETSGRRSAARNASVGGNPHSKHILGMARDFVGPSAAANQVAAEEANDLGLWWKLHDTGSGDHLHTQGLPPGPPPVWWVSKYGDEHDLIDDREIQT